MKFKCASTFQKRKKYNSVLLMLYSFSCIHKQVCLRVYAIRTWLDQPARIKSMLRTCKLRHVVTATRLSYCLSELQRSEASLRRVLAGPHETDASKTNIGKGKGTF